MKNGRALQGHRRVLSGARLRPWTSGCICGWSLGGLVNATTAKHEYRKHLDHLIDDVPLLCKVCGDRKPVTEMRSDYRHMCKRCFSRKGNQWQLLNPAASARHKRDHHLRRHFGISGAMAEQMLVDQGGVCAICKTAIADKRGFSPHVDHDHSTGVVRGILCFNCNSGLGSFKDDVIRLRAAVAYLKKHSTRGAQGLWDVPADVLTRIPEHAR